MSDNLETYVENRGWEFEEDEDWGFDEEYSPETLTQKMRRIQLDVFHAVKDFAYDAKYSWKNFFAVLSGFSRLEHRTRNWDGNFEQILPEKGDYVCTYFSLCVFNNGSKIPLPIIMDDYPMQNRIQKFWMEVADKFSCGLSAAKTAVESFYDFMYVEDSENYLSEETLARLRAIKFAEDDDTLFEE